MIGFVRYRWIVTTGLLLTVANTIHVVDAADISFRNDVMAVLSKSGCNAGTCHGNAKGKGGFQLSLRGQDPDLDYRALTREWTSRRINSVTPSESLILLKATYQIPHEGGRRFTSDSLEYQILRTWIEQGSQMDSDNRSRVISIDVIPDNLVLKKRKTTIESTLTPTGDNGPNASSVDWSFQITVTARFSDGSTSDVTQRSVYEFTQPIADVSSEGFVTGTKSGETTILVRFLDQQAAIRLAFLSEGRATAITSTRETPANPIDQFVQTKLDSLDIVPSPLCDDGTFQRRLYLDMMGIIPTSIEAQAFMTNSDRDKRARLIDEVLDRPEFAEWWALKWADMLRVEEKTLDRKGVETFYAWLRDSFATGKPVDQLVREIVSSLGSTYEVPPTNFYRAHRLPFERSEAIGQLFQGVRLQCAKCHNHPFDRWTQDDYYGWGSLFSRIDYKIIENFRRDKNDLHEFDGEQIVFLSNDAKIRGQAKDPRINKVRSVRFLGETKGRLSTVEVANFDMESTDDRSESRVDAEKEGSVDERSLESMAKWLTDPQNDRFVHTMANRIWYQVMAKGIVDPVDDFRATNPPSNSELLNYLANELHAPSLSNRNVIPFDIRHLIRLILNSNTYQRASETNDSNVDDETNFSHTIVRRLSAEQLLDGISQVCGVPNAFAGYPVGFRSRQIPGVAARGPNVGSPTSSDRFLKLFGKPPRLQSCDCERSDEPTLNQTFQLVSGTLVNDMLSNPNNRLTELEKPGMPLEEIVTELYWSTLTRSPSAEEMELVKSSWQRAGQRREPLEDLLWSLINSNEFLIRR
ncbi:MAG: DUF1549 domain-containing protein [Planctomycetes bacterium]|nr:DUF1549 domain-containing protein [Planctomycetota bacterium]